MAKISDPERTSSTSSSPTCPSRIAPENSESVTPLDRSGPAGCSSPISSSAGLKLSCQRRLHHTAGLAEIHLAGVFHLQDPDHLAHVLHSRSARLGDGGGDRRLYIGFRHLPGQVSRDDRDLVALLRGEFGATALFVQLDRLLALLDHFLEHAEQVGVTEGWFTFPARGAVGILDGRIDHP